MLATEQKISDAYALIIDSGHHSFQWKLQRSTPTINMHSACIISALYARREITHLYLNEMDLRAEYVSKVDARRMRFGEPLFLHEGSPQIDYMCEFRVSNT